MIPKFDMYYEHLHASFILFDNYLKFLKNEFFNGFILAENNNNSTYFFLFEGELQSAFSVSGNQTEAEILLTHDFFIPKDCYISTYRCPHKYVDYFSRFHAAKLVYNNVSKDKISPEKLFEKFKKDQFDGFIEKHGTQSSPKKSYVYFDKGDIIGGLYLDKKDGIFESELNIDLARENITKSLFSIYTLGTQVRDQDKERSLIIDCFQTIFQMMEARTNPSDFSLLWRKSAMELSNRYGFLDPLIGEFQYKGQQLHLYEKTNIKPAALGMNELVYRIAERLSISKNDVKKIKNNYSSILAAYEIRN
ncbi:MAG: hypothetical protein GY699_14590 [Desulfobacteraceae bacterium]|nr:hypothetical protein [Desulfobacteraceae bacterium]